MSPTISVIIPLHNSEELIGETMTSLINQNYTNFEVILIDDFSADNTLEMVKPYLNSNGINVSIYRNTLEKGISNSLNIGLSKAVGKYIAYSDHDDISLPDRFRKQIDILEEHQEIGVCGSWMKEFGNGDNLWKYPTEHDDLMALSLIQSPIANPTAMFRSELLKRYNLKYNHKYDLAQDFAFWLDMLIVTNFYVIPEALVMYRVHSGNASTVNRQLQFRSWKKSFEDKISSILLDEKLSEDEMLTIYNFKYPFFREYYKSNKKMVDETIRKILNANEATHVFSPISLQRLFAKYLK